MTDIKVEPVGVRLLLDGNAMTGSAKSGGRRFWTNREIAAVREHYPAGGLPACLPHLPGRSASSIYQRACKLDLRAPGGVAFSDRKRITSSAAIDDAIRRWHAAGATRNGLVALVRSTIRPRRWLTNRAAKLGLASPRHKPLPWSEAEDAIMRQMAGKAPFAAVAALRRAGFLRTQTAVSVRWKRLNVSRLPENAFTATELGELLGVDGKAVTGWIEKGWMKAGRVSSADGSPYRIKPVAIRAFIMDNVSALKLGRVDPHWFVDLLANRA